MALNTEVVDLGDVERLDVLPAGGTDQMHVADLSGTDVTNVDFLLTLARGTTARDGSPDSVLVDGTNGTDALSVTSGGASVRTTGLAAVTTVGFGEKTQDRLNIDPLVHPQVLLTSD